MSIAEFTEKGVKGKYGNRSVLFKTVNPQNSFGRYAADGQRSYDIRRSHGAGAHAVSHIVADELILDQVELEVALELFADVGGQADAHGLQHDFGSGHRGSAGADTVQEIADMVHRSLGAADIIGDDFLEFAEHRRRGDIGSGVSVGGRGPALGAVEPLAAGAAPILAWIPH